jgi:hypothetical protein
MTHHAKRPQEQGKTNLWSFVPNVLKCIPSRILEYIIIILLTNHQAFQDLISLIKVIRGG